MPSNVAVETRFLNIAGSLGRVCFRMKTGQRGILLGGWAEMSAAALEGEEDSQELLAYCKDSRAAQEWMTLYRQYFAKHSTSSARSNSYLL